LPVRCTSPCFNRRYDRRVVNPGERLRLERAGKSGWTVVSMQNDFKVVFDR
jgi:hypothetical protein